METLVERAITSYVKENKYFSPVNKVPTFIISPWSGKNVVFYVCNSILANSLNWVYMHFCSYMKIW